MEAMGIEEYQYGDRESKFSNNFFCINAQRSAALYDIPQELHGIFLINADPKSTHSQRLPDNYTYCNMLKAN